MSDDRTIKVSLLLLMKGGEKFFGKVQCSLWPPTNFYGHSCPVPQPMTLILMMATRYQEYENHGESDNTEKMIRRTKKQMHTYNFKLMQNKILVCLMIYIKLSYTFTFHDISLSLSLSPIAIINIWKKM